MYSISARCLRRVLAVRTSIIHFPVIMALDPRNMRIFFLVCCLTVLLIPPCLGLQPFSLVSSESPLVVYGGGQSESVPTPTVPLAAFVSMYWMNIRCIGLLVNVLDEHSNPVLAVSRFVATRTPYPFAINTAGLSLAQMRAVTLVTLDGGILQAHNIDLYPMIRTAFVANTTYHYQLSSTCSGHAKPTKLNPGWGSQLAGFGNSMGGVFQIVGLPYTFEANRMMIVIPLWNASFT